MVSTGLPAYAALHESLALALLLGSPEQFAWRRDSQGWYKAGVRERLLIFAITVAFLALIAWPASWPKGRDSFPLSPYPMFARKKSSPSLTMEYAIALDAEGTPSFVAPHYIGSGEVLQARALIHGAIARGGNSAAEFCKLVLQRLQKDTKGIQQLQLVRGTHDSVAYLQGDKSKSREKVLVQCQR